MTRSSTWLTIGALAIGIGTGVACQREPDVQQAAQTALQQEQIEGVEVEWDRDAQVLHLKGEVDSDFERSRVEEIATGAVGTSGTVVNEVTLKPVDAPPAAEAEATVRAQIDAMFDSDPSLRDRDIEIEVLGGVATLKGQVRSEEEKQRAFELASQVPGVQQVVNTLEVGSGQGGR